MSSRSVQGCIPVCAVDCVSVINKWWFCFFKQGIISRVTESVKNIVPGWLQKYFNKSEDECVDTNESTNQEESPVNYHHDYANEDTIVIDGRVTPESARINLEGM